MIGYLLDIYWISMICFRIKIHVAVSVGSLIKFIKPQAKEISSSRSPATLCYTAILR